MKAWLGWLAGVWLGGVCGILAFETGADIGRSARLLNRETDGGFLFSDGRRFDLGPGATDYFTIWPEPEARRVCFDIGCARHVSFTPDAGWVAEGFGRGCR